MGDGDGIRDDARVAASLLPTTTATSRREHGCFSAGSDDNRVLSRLRDRARRLCSYVAELPFQLGATGISRTTFGQCDAWLVPARARELRVRLSTTELAFRKADCPTA